MATTKTGAPLDRGTLDTLLRRRLFYTPSFEIYGGVSGLYDYGPPGCALQAAIVDMWRKHFVLEEDMLEVDCTMLTPHDVLKTSGHVDKFADWMCKDPKSGEIFRADHLVEEVLEARLKGDKEARGEKVVEVEDEDKKKRKKKVKDIKVVKLDEAVRKEYEETLAKVGLVSLGFVMGYHWAFVSWNWCLCFVSVSACRGCCFLLYHWHWVKGFFAAMITHAVFGFSLLIYFILANSPS